MLRNVSRIVTTWPFLLGLSTLLVNDAWFKGAYPGFLSGKLSDFAGIAIVGLLLLAAQPQRRRLVCGGIIVGFAWLKSTFSQPAIDAIDSLLSYPIGRTVDYADLIALVVLPACATVASNPSPFALRRRALRRLSIAPVALLTVLGLMATSVMPTRHDYQVRRADRAPVLDREAIAATIAEVAAAHGLRCGDCSGHSGGGRFDGDGLHLSYSFSGTRTVSFRVDALPDGIFFGARGREKADRLRDDLKSRLASSYEDLEYTERLGPTPSSAE